MWDRSVCPLRKGITQISDTSAQCNAFQVIIKDTASSIPWAKVQFIGNKQNML